MVLFFETRPSLCDFNFKSLLTRQVMRSVLGIREKLLVVTSFDDLLRLPGDSGSGIHWAILRLQGNN